MAMRQTYTMTISLPPQLARKAQKLMQKTVMTRSELFREALRRYFLDEEEEYLLMKALRAKANKIGLKSEEDVAEMVDEFRQ